MKIFLKRKQILIFIFPIFLSICSCATNQFKKEFLNTAIEKEIHIINYSPDIRVFSAKVSDMGLAGLLVTGVTSSLSNIKANKGLKELDRTVKFDYKQFVIDEIANQINYNIKFKNIKIVKHPILEKEPKISGIVSNIYKNNSNIKILFIFQVNKIGIFSSYGKIKNDVSLELNFQVYESPSSKNSCNYRYACNPEYRTIKYGGNYYSGDLIFSGTYSLNDLYHNDGALLKERLKFAISQILNKLNTDIENQLFSNEKIEKKETPSTNEENKF